ncbi:MAG: DUF3597 domain-containing protein [Steroidobacteraceae bacterium]
MSIFDAIKTAIFAHAPTPAVPNRPATPDLRAGPPGLPPVDARTGMIAPPGPATPVPQPVDIEAALNGLVRKSGQKMDWQTSIVDLLKLVGLDPSLQNRRQLAQELGYKGDTADSAAMNVWLHRQVMTKLEANGGKLPDSLRR